jgi:hypothetical protein
VPRHSLPTAALVALAGVCDAAGAHGAAFWLLVLAVPLAALAALLVLGAALEAEGDGRLTHAWLQGAALALILFGAAARAPFRAEGSVPRVALSALVACLLLYGAQAVLALAPALRARTARALEGQGAGDGVLR